jgi:phosphate/sulfate permease
MSAGIVGALVGLALALGYLAFARALGRRVELEDTRKALNVSAIVQIVLLPVMGYAAATFAFGD